MTTMNLKNDQISNNFATYQLDRSETSHHNNNKTNPNYNNNFQVGYDKIDFPKFVGTDPQEWVFKYERSFCYHGVAKKDKVYVASINLEGMILDWIQNNEITNTQVLQQIFLKYVIQHYGPNAYKETIRKLTKLQQLAM